MTLARSLLLQHDELDRQHGRLFELIDAAVAVHETGTAAELAKAICAFTDAMLAHCASEEALMEESLYPDRGRHRVAHEIFLADLQQLQAELASTGPTPSVGGWLRVRLPEWLRFHIAVNDAPLGSHLARRPSSPRAARRADSRRPS